MALDMSPGATDLRAALRDAASQGYWLTRRHIDNGEYAWTWLRHGDDSPQPWFLTRRQAVDYISDKLSG
jgi:hypothetical protein